jgi:FeS assembly protein IscX
VALRCEVLHRSPIASHPSLRIAEELIVPPTFDWDAIEDIAIALSDKFPDTDPLTVRFTDMLKWITELPGFSGDPQKSNESKLEAIQMAWHEEFQDRQS